MYSFSSSFWIFLTKQKSKTSSRGQNGIRFRKEKVCSNKDVSEGRDKDEIAKRDLPELIAGCLLQIVCR